MKNLFFTLLIAFGYLTTANAQNENRMWVGGTVGFSSTKIDQLDAKISYKILPEFGYILNQNLAIGTSLGYTYSELDSDVLAYQIIDPKSKVFTIAPFLRYTFMKGNIGALFVDAGVAYAHATVTGTTYSNGLFYPSEIEAKQNMFEIGFRPGVYIAVSKKINLLGKFGFIGYEHTKAEFKQSSGNNTTSELKANRFVADLDMSQLLMGVNILF